MAHTSFDRRRALAFAALYAGVLSSDILVDDSDPSIIYTPSNGWAEGTTCITCTTFPNSSKAQNGTWHNINPKPGVGTPRASFIFTGTGVRVYAILPAYSASDDPNVPIIHTDATFFLDNIVQGTDYEYFPPVGADYQYHHLIFNSSTLALGEHTLMVQSSFDDVSVLLLDYIVYTVPNTTTLASGNSTITTRTSQPQSPIVTTSTATTGASPDAPVSAPIKPTAGSSRKSSVPSTAVVAGAIAGSLAFLVCLLAVIIYLLRVRRARRRFVAVANHLEKSQDVDVDGDQQHFEEPHREQSSASAIKAPLSENVCSPFLGPEPRLSVHDYVSVAERFDSLPISNMDLAAAPAPPGDSELLLPHWASQNVATVRTISVANALSSPRGPSSEPATLIDNSHMEAASDKVPMAPSGSDSHHGRAPPVAPASTRPHSDVDSRPSPTGMADALAPNAGVRHPSLASDASLREQLAALRNEVARIRAQQEALPGDAPPPYDDTR